MLPAAIYSQFAAAQQSVAALSDPIVQAALANSTASISTTSNHSSASSNDPTPTGSRDTTFTKIFVGGLPYHTTDESLHNYFKQFGEIEEAVVITDRQTQKSRGYGFVTMKERIDAEKACKDPNPIIDGRKANVNLAYLGAKPRNNVHLAALSTSLQQIPQLQAAQLQAAANLLPTASRIGIPQLYFPGASAAAVMQNAFLTNVSTNNTNQLAAQLQPAALAAAAAQAQQHLAAVSQTNAAAGLIAASAGNTANSYVHSHLQQQLHSQQQPALQQIDYATLAAAAAAAASAQNNNAFATITAPGLEQYSYSLGLLPTATNSAYAAQLSAAAAQAQFAVAASGAGHGTLDNARV